MNASRTTRIRFWQGKEADLDLEDIQRSAVRVKGISYHNPLRFLEIYGNARRGDAGRLSWSEIQQRFFPRIPGVTFELGDTIPQPPFAWRDATPMHLAISFTYNTNALYRILSNLSREGRLEAGKVDTLLDDACLMLATLYQANEHFLIKNINNNFNMYLISKVVEALVGRRCYDSERQEVAATRRSLHAALALMPEHANLSLIEKMSTALGRGVSFIESQRRGARLDRAAVKRVQDVSFRFFGTALAIDDRQTLLGEIAEAGRCKNDFELAVVLDDAAESVDDLLWLQDLLLLFPFLRVHLLVNIVQVSINFCSQMLAAVRRHSIFRHLFSLAANRLRITPIYCPFISFQSNLLPPVARGILDAADAVFIKGANFFETCQLPEKNVYHAFVVYGPISRACSGLQDLDGVFARVPSGVSGYRSLPGLGFVPLTQRLGSVA